MGEVITSAGKPVDLTKEQALELLRQMWEIRLFEDTVYDLLGQNKIKGASHLYAGQEAVAVGAISTLREDDLITSTHRGHGHVIAKGLRFDRMMAELYGRTTGYCKGKGGSMHIADFSQGVLGANGIVAAGLPIATGAALSAQMRRSGQVVAAFFGDGATSQGAFHEAANLAAVWNLPIVYVCENNHYAVSTPVSRQMRIPSVAQRAAAYGFPGATVDGNDPLAVYEAARAAVERARSGGGPTLLECRTYRWMGHYIGDPATYRPAEEVAWWKERDPLTTFERRLIEMDLCSQEEIQRVHEQVRAELEAAVQFARQSPVPAPEDALTDLPQ